jgi:hypothetical protein
VSSTVSTIDTTAAVPTTIAASVPASLRVSMQQLARSNGRTLSRETRVALEEHLARSREASAA